MTGTQIYRILQTVMAFATIGWLGVFGYANYVGSQCNQAFNKRAASNQAQLNTVELRKDKILSREKSLQSRSGELIKKLDGPDSGQQ
jgi:hypothetical protein